MTRVWIGPQFRGKDKGDGGIRRVVEAQRKWLPLHGVEIANTPSEADVIALHAGEWPDAKIPPGTPIVAHCHGLYWEGYSWAKWAEALNKDVIRTIRRADLVTAPSEWVANAIRRGTWAQVVPLYHGIEPSDWTEVEQHDGYVLWNKNRPDPICDPTPVNKLAELAPDISFITTYGDKKSNVTVMEGGRQPYEKAKQQVKRAMVYLATSRETFGIGTLEAMAAGVPVLGWNWGGQAEFVKHFEHGYLAEPGNYDDLRKGLSYCIKHRDILGEAARKYVLDNFTNEQRMAPYAKLYTELHNNFKDRPKVSVVITNYNLGRYLPETVESVLSQVPYKDIECVLVDDASTEPLPPGVQDRIDKGHIKLVRNEKNLYLAEALNAGIQASRGHYIVPLDADNELAPGSLKVLADALDDDRALDIAYGKVEFFKESDPSKRFVSEWPPAEANPAEQLLHRNQIPSTSMYRRKVWSRSGGYRRRCRTAEDADFWSRAQTLGFRGRQVTGAVTLIYRDRDDSMSHVQKDWDWHKWYAYAQNPELRLWAAGGPNIPTHEFPLVSVVIPVGPGHERLVLDALDSLQNQTFRHWEAVVINDTGKELPWMHSWAKVEGFYSDGKLVAPQGVATARNIGLTRSKGKYVLFLDADDYLHPQAIERMFETIKLTGGFVYSDWFEAETGAIKSVGEFDPDIVLKQMPYPVTCMYDLTELVEKNIWFDRNFDGKGWEDWDFQMQVIAQHGICGHRVPAALFHYRYQSGTLREKAFANREELKQEIFNKWAPYIKGEKENMAKCGGCGGFRTPEMSAYRNGHDPAQTQANPEEGETVLVKYLSDEPGKRSFRGIQTGTRYTFNTDDEEHRIRKVYKDDANGLLSLGWFQVLAPASATPSNEALEPLLAAGPPAR